jgi:hypothetical protein
VYRNRLKTYTRQLVFLKPHYVVIYDDAVARDKPRTFDWLLHLSNKPDLEMLPASAVYSTPKATMGIQILEPVHSSLATRTGHLPFSLLNTAAAGPLPPVPAILDVRPAAPSLQQNFLVVLSLAREKKEATDFMTRVTKISGIACTGVQIGEQRLFFSSSLESGYGDWTTNARTWSFSPEMVSGEDTTVIRKGKRIIWLSTAAASFIANRSSQGIGLTVSSERPAKIRFYSGFKPAANTAFTYSKDDGVIELSIAGGSHTWIFSPKRGH